MTDVIAAINEQNATNPSGRIGREPAPSGTQFTIPVTTDGRLTTPEQFADIILRARPDGSLLRVRDVGTVVLGSRSYDNVIRLNGKPTAGLIVFLRPGANALAAKDGVVARMNQLAQHFPPGVHWVVGFDLTPFITASIHEVEITLFIAIVLVTIVVYIFLQKWRSTLIPAFAVPVSIIGTFLGMALLGFTVNLLTLFALVLSIGIVVDDAIIVIENVERTMEDEHVSARVAADRAIRQLRSALIAIVIVLCSVFIPVAFIGGITGALYKQFAVTIVISVVLSGVVALSLTPALCSILLTETKTAPQTGFFGWFNRTFDRARNKYVTTMHKVSPYSAAAVGVLVVAVGVIAVLYKRRPIGFLPTEDKGYFITAVELPGSSSTQRTTKVVEKVEQFLLQQPGVDHVFALSGFSLIQGVNQTSSATLFVVLKPWDQRKTKGGAGGRTAAVVERLLLHADPGGVRLRLQRPGDLRARHHLRPGAESPGPRCQQHGKFAALAQQFAQDLGKTGRCRRRQHDHPRRRAAAVPRCRSRQGQIARGVADGRLHDAPDHARVRLRQ